MNKHHKERSITMPKPLPDTYRKIPWRVDSEFAQKLEDAVNAVNRHLPPKERLSFNQVIQAAMEEYWPKLETLAKAAVKEEK
jgi:hypothetical protein